MVRIIFVVALFAAMLTACGTAEARGYEGTWKSDDGTFVAQIKNKQIVINLHADGDTALYWKGTFGYGSPVIISKADTEALDGALFGSQDKTKQFVYRNHRLRFRMSMMGVTRTISLKKV